MGIIGAARMVGPDPDDSDEQRDWERLQQVVSSGVEAYWVTIAGWCEIQCRKLYRDGYFTFQSYRHDQDESSWSEG